MVKRSIDVDKNLVYIYQLSILFIFDITRSKSYVKNFANLFLKILNIFFFNKYVLVVESFTMLA